MEPFNLDTAVSLLPLMDDSENVTKQLISALEVYNTHVDETTKPQLINFVIKTRLSESAKFKLGTETKNYGKVQDLLSDMKKNLLVKKSATAIQQQMVNSKQNDRNIDQFGKEIETLFMDLTISQADGDMTKTGILKPINEKLAITQFAKGLKNQRLSTIVTARNYQTLKLAIQGAKDEESIMFPGGSKAVKEGNYNVFHPNPGGGRGGFGHNAPPNRGYPSGPDHQKSGSNLGNHHPGGKPVHHSGGNQQNISHSLSGKAGSVEDLFSKPHHIDQLHPGHHHGQNNSHRGHFGGNRGGSHANRGFGHTRGGQSGNNHGGGHSSPCSSASLHGGGHSNRGHHNNYGQNHSQKQHTHPNHPKPQNNQNHSQNHPQKQHTTQNHPQKPHTTQNHPQKPHTTQNHAQKPHTTQNHPQKPHTTQNHPPKPPANHTNKNSGPTGNKNSFTQNKPKTGGNQKATGGATEILVKIKIPRK